MTDIGDPLGAPQRPPDTQTYQGINEVRRRLVGWMRYRRIETATITVIENGKHMGNFTVQHVDRETSIVEAPDVTLFQPSRYRPMRIEHWLRNTFRCNPYNAQFLAAETPNTNTTDSKRAEPPPEEEVRKTTIEPAKTPEMTPSEPTQTSLSESTISHPVPKPQKAPRQPRRKKPTKAEIKERAERRVKEEREEIIERLLEQCTLFQKSLKPHALSAGAIGDWIENARSQYERYLAPLVNFIVAHDSEIPRIAVLLRSPKYIRVRAVLASYSDNREMVQQHVASADSRTRRGNLALTKLVSGIFANQKDMFRDMDYLRHAGTTGRVADEYRDLLFFELGGQEQVTREISEAHNEFWLDIGAGTTYRNPESLMNVARTVNPSLTFAGLDLLYDWNRASYSDIAYGNADLEEFWASKNTLIPGGAQRIPREDESVDRILSCWVFDKFVDNPGALEQAFNEVARVLKPGGTARIYPVPKQFLQNLKSSPYFDLMHNTKIKEEYNTNSPVKAEDRNSVVLRRRKLTPLQMAELHAARDAWYEKHRDA
ncbi:methyltransferase domain-containing protein [Candidatus Kaiserbacteria bacterium]|nr:methyltransferase domain-containing protein [Candidatus Kaiserbacteria bacterium]